MSNDSSEARRKRLLQIGSAALFLAVVAVAVAIVVNLSDTAGGDAELEDVDVVKSELRGIPQNELTLGDPQAPVTLTEFGDLQCPACKAFAEEALPSVIDSKVRSGVAKIEFRNYTIISEESTTAAAAAVAAGRQGRGWSFIELFYRNQGAEASGYVTDAFLTTVAKGAGVTDIGRWNRDRKGADVLGEVEATDAEASGLGFSGTPFFAIQGPSKPGFKVLGPLRSAEEVEAVIDEAS
jgi:protein-disulfide isomerase